MDVAISRLHFPITTLGPGRRIGVWFQGCSIRCPGCISLDTWDPNRGHLPIGKLLEGIEAFAPAADGLTVSGGEPFDQPEGLSVLLRHWRSISSRSTLVFTGREPEHLACWLARNPELIDAIVTGPFRSEFPQTMALRGSDNQRLTILSERGREFHACNRPLEPKDKKLDVMFDERGEAWLVGIPARGELGRLRRALQAAGHRALTSDSSGGFLP